MRDGVPSAQSDSSPLDSLAALLRSEPNAEELSSVWYGGVAAGGRASPSCTAHVGSQAGTPTKSLSLRAFKKGLDSGRPIKAAPGRGVPLWIVIRTLKASWHADGTWPLLGADEQEEDTAQATAVAAPADSAGSSDKDVDSVAVSASARSSTATRSIYAAHLLVRPDRASSQTNGPGRPMDPGPPARPDPDPADVAAMYAARAARRATAPPSS